MPLRSSPTTRRSEKTGYTDEEMKMVLLSRKILHDGLASQ